MSEAFTFQEVEVPRGQALRVELRDHDLPHAKILESAGFEGGGEVKLSKVVIPGRPEPLFQVRVSNDERDMEVNGAFRDFRMGRNHARDMRDLIERVRYRANLVDITWGSDSWRGLLAETLFGYEGVGHITYKLRFAIARAPGNRSARQPQQRRGGVDALASIRERLRAERIPRDLNPSTLQRVMRFLSDVEKGVDAISEGIQQANNVANTVGRQVRRVTSLVTQLQSKVSEFNTALENTMAQAMVVRRQIESVADVQAWKFRMLINTSDLRENLRATKEEERRRERAGTKLYRVRDGDTLETIAREKLGDPGRANDLGYQPRDLVPGRVLRIPEA